MTLDEIVEKYHVNRVSTAELAKKLGIPKRKIAIKRKNGIESTVWARIWRPEDIIQLERHIKLKRIRSRRDNTI